VPIVVMSAARDASRAVEDLGAQAFLAKPFELEAVLRVLEELAPNTTVRQSR
jgi:FixJ family two-component response regulator